VHLKNKHNNYDYLFFFFLSLALEKKGIKTLALQERPSSSFYHYLYGVFCDVYLYSGKIWMDYGLKNNSIISKKSINFAPWRSKFFHNSDLNVSEFKFLDSRRGLADFKKIILFLGYFLDEDAHFYLTGASANEKFLDYVVSVAQAHPDIAVIVRMKSFNDAFACMARAKLSFYQNIFISNDYSMNALSYSFCSAADIIVSVNTSIADEALYSGKKVLLIDDLGVVSNVCSGMYPDVFGFVIMKSETQLLDAVCRILNDDTELEGLYAQLSDHLSGVDVSSPDAIPDAIEKHFLQID